MRDRTWPVGRRDCVYSLPAEGNGMVFALHTQLQLRCLLSATQRQRSPPQDPQNHKFRFALTCLPISLMKMPHGSQDMRGISVGYGASVVIWVQHSSASVRCEPTDPGIGYGIIAHAGDIVLGYIVVMPRRMRGRT